MANRDDIGASKEPPTVAFCPKCNIDLVNTTCGLYECSLCHGPVIGASKERQQQKVVEEKEFWDGEVEFFESRSAAQPKESVQPSSENHDCFETVLAEYLKDLQ
jgi:hypothetical protein